MARPALSELKELGRADSVVATPAGGSQITDYDIKGLEGAPNPELKEKVTGSNRTGRTYLGNDASTFTYTTGDRNMILAFPKGKRGTGLTASIQAPATAIVNHTSDVTLENGDVVLITMSSFVVSEATTIKASDDGMPAEVKLTFKLQQNADGSDGTMAVALD